MKVCLILEGCYPYVYGGVSTWVNQYIKETPDIEYTLCTIYPNRKDKGKFVYDIPANVTKIYEYFLDDFDKVDGGKKNKRIVINKNFVMEIRNLILAKKVDWNIIFGEVSKKDWNLESFFQSVEYMDLIKNLSDSANLKQAGFTNTFFNVRSMLIPILYLLSSISKELPNVDLYHSIVSGYGGVIASALSYLTKKPLILTEHGLYPREREEELVQATWIMDEFRSIWINFFYELSRCVYNYASAVTSLFHDAKRLQIEMGCDAKKCRVIANGIDYDRFSSISIKDEDDFVDIGAIIRFSPIKDVKTLIYAFYELKTRCSKARLHILGGTNDEEYKEECLKLIKDLNIEDIIIHGQVDTYEALKTLDFTVLTSISEGQPLVILEAMAASRPVVCTNVGCCKEIVEGLNDDFGPAGFCCQPMDYLSIADAMYKLCMDQKLCLKMGANGKKRAKNEFRYKTMLDSYINAYNEVIKSWQE